MKRIGLITSGGDAPGMNTAVRAVVRAAAARNIETFGFEDGYDGVLQGRGRVVTARDVGDILHRGGTMLRTARCLEMKTPEGLEKALRTLNRLEIEGLVVIGGDGSLRGGLTLNNEGIRVVGIPASIDNDIWGTQMALGVDSALNTIMEAIDKLRDTASSHQRAFLIETMGRDSGYLAAMAGVIGGAELVLVPERETPLEEVGRVVLDAHRRGKPHCFIIVAEGASHDARTIAEYLNAEGIGFESRVTTLGHVQRGGSPSAFDRMLASRMGVHAVEALVAGESGVMIGLQGGNMTTVPLDEVCAGSNTPELGYLEMTRLLAR